MGPGRLPGPHLINAKSLHADEAVSSAGPRQLLTFTRTAADSSVSRTVADPEGRKYA